MSYVIRIDLDPEPEQVPTRVEQYFDRSTRSWITYLADQSGVQIGDANVDGTKADAAASRRSFESRIK